VHILHVYALNLYLTYTQFQMMFNTQRVLCHTDGQGSELVLDHIVERKRMDDLSTSIIDGRFAEQKV